MREVERLYSKIKTEPAKDDRINCYTCLQPKCLHITKTIDIHEGRTPFMHTCEKCGHTAQSTFYKDVDPEKEPTQEWYRPTLKQCQKMRNKPQMLDHIFKGGLDVRPIIK